MTALANTFKTAVASLIEQYRSQIEQLAQRIREELVLPACREHGLTFISGNGWYQFEKTSDSMSPMRNARAARENGIDLDEVFDVLDVQVEGHFELGHFVHDVQEEDYMQKSFEGAQVVCPYCEITRAVNSDGLVRAHKNPVSGKRCQGSGRACIYMHYAPTSKVRW